ncbi:unnamed protein product, partial [Heterosigma akashiwo]
GSRRQAEPRGGSAPRPRPMEHRPVRLLRRRGDLLVELVVPCLVHARRGRRPRRARWPPPAAGSP